MSTKQILPQTASNQPTRRQFLQALATLPAAALPALPTVPIETPEPPTVAVPLLPNRPHSVPQTAEALIKRLSDLSITMAVIPIWLHSRLNITEEIDPIKVLKQFDEAYAAAEEYQGLLLTTEFEDLLLKPLCGGPERYTEVMNTWQESKAITPFSKQAAAYLDIATIAIELAAKA